MVGTIASPIATMFQGAGLNSEFSSGMAGAEGLFGPYLQMLQQSNTPSSFMMGELNGPTLDSSVSTPMDAGTFQALLAHQEGQQPSMQQFQTHVPAEASEGRAVHSSTKHPAFIAASLVAQRVSLQSNESLGVQSANHTPIDRTMNGLPHHTGSSVNASSQSVMAIEHVMAQALDIPLSKGEIAPNPSDGTAFRQLDRRFVSTQQTTSKDTAMSASQFIGATQSQTTTSATTDGTAQNLSYEERLLMMHHGSRPSSIDTPSIKADAVEMMMPKTTGIDRMKAMFDSASKEGGIELESREFLTQSMQDRSAIAKATPLQGGHMKLQIEQAMVAEQVIVKMMPQLAKGISKMSIQLDPAHLGQVEVELQTNREGYARVIVQAERPEVVEFLRQDAKSLEKALEQAGLKADSQSMEFQLKDQRQSFDHQHAAASLEFEQALEEAKQLVSTQWTSNRRLDLSV